MSVIYEKSKSEKFKKYFTSEKEIAERLSCYSLIGQKLSDMQSVEYNKWDNGSVGIPLVWNSNNMTVSVDHTDTHSLVIGPTGSKKSRLIVMPLVRILGSTGESMIIADPKAEIYNRTADYLKQQNYQLFVLNLRSPMHGNRWNPLAIPYDFYSRGEIDKSYEFVNDIAQNLIKSLHSNNDPFWDDSAGSFFFGLVLLLFKYCKDTHLDATYVHMGNVIKLRNALFLNAGRGINKTLWNYAKEDDIVTSSLIGTVETANDTRAGILSTFDQKTRMFLLQPNILDMLANNDIDFESIGQKPTAVFLIVPDEKTGYHGLVSLFIKQSYEYLIYKAQTTEENDGFHVGTLKNRLNYVLDEFSSLPTINDFPAMVTAARSRNIRFTLVVQSKHQLLQRYKEETETIQTNCNNWIFFTSRELQILEEISSLCGKTVEDSPKPVLSISDLQRLDKTTGEALILCGRAKPCISRLADISIYDNDNYLSTPAPKRVPNPPPVLSILLNEKEEKSTIDVDSFIQKIDARIAELEAEEKKSEKTNDNQP